MTLEDVFVSKLKSDPVHVLELSREFLEQGGGRTYAREVIDRHVLAWMDSDEAREELGRSVLGFELVNMLRPI